MTADTPNPTAPDTIVLIHGLWVTPRSWEKWVERYTQRGYRVLTPAYPGLEVEVEALNEDPSPIEALTIPRGPATRRPAPRERQLEDLERSIQEAIEESCTSLPRMFGVGPILAAKIIGRVGNVFRFPTKAHFASYTGTQLPSRALKSRS